MEKVLISLHELKSLVERFNDLNEALSFAMKELDDIRMFLHGKITMEELECTYLVVLTMF